MPVNIVTPNNLAGTEGAIDNGYPFSVAETMRYQQVYNASQFGSLAGGGMITAIAFRPDARYGYAFTHTIGNIRIDLSTTTAGPGGLSLTFANNVGANDTTVFNGALTLSSAFTGSPAGGPRNFDIVIQLTTPFFYNPAAGNLLLDIRDFSSGNSGGTLLPQLDATRADPTLVGRVYAFDASAMSAPYSFQQDTIGLVTRFTASVPDSGAATGLLLGLTGLMLIKKRQLARTV